MTAKRLISVWVLRSTQEHAGGLTTPANQNLNAAKPVPVHCSSPPQKVHHATLLDQPAAIVQNHLQRHVRRPSGRHSTNQGIQRSHCPLRDRQPSLHYCVVCWVAPTAVPTPTAADPCARSWCCAVRIAPPPPAVADAAAISAPCAAAAPLAAAAPQILTLILDRMRLPLGVVRSCGRNGRMASTTAWCSGPCSAETMQ